MRYLALGLALALAPLGCSSSSGGGTTTSDTDASTSDTGATTNDTGVDDTGATTSDTDVDDTGATTSDTGVDDTGAATNDTGATSSGDTGGDAADDGGASSDGATALTCPTGPDLGTAQHGRHVADPYPTPLGGAIQDGTYVRTDTIFYDGTTGPDPDTFQGTIVVSGNTMQEIDYVSPGPEGRIAGTFTVSGTELTATITCLNGQMLSPGVAHGPSPFTATATVFKLYDPTEKKESIYVRQ